MKTETEQHLFLLVDDSSMKRLTPKFQIRSIYDPKNTTTISGNGEVQTTSAEIPPAISIDEQTDGFAAVLYVKSKLMRKEKLPCLIMMDYFMPRNRDLNNTENIENGIQTAWAIRKLFRSEQPASITLGYLNPKAGGLPNGHTIGYLIRELFIQDSNPEMPTAPKILGFSDYFSEHVVKPSASNLKATATAPPTAADGTEIDTTVNCDQSCFDDIVSPPATYDTMQVKLTALVPLKAPKVTAK